MEEAGAICAALRSVTATNVHQASANPALFPVSLESTHKGHGLDITDKLPEILTEAATMERRVLRLDLAVGEDGKKTVLRTKLGEPFTFSRLAAKV